MSMDKKIMDGLTKQYGPLITWFIESNSPYLNIDTKIRWHFTWDDNIAITGSVNRKTNIMSINVLFVDKAYRDNKVFDIEYFLLHEIRHFYQHNQIKKYKTNSHTVDPVFIERWIKEGKEYITALDDSGNESIDYYKQDCELDAYAFSYAVMKHKYSGLYDSKLFVPEIYKRNLKDEFDSATRDFLNDWE